MLVKDKSRKTDTGRRWSSHSFEACATVPNTVCGAYFATTFAYKTLKTSRFDARFVHLVHHVELFACVLAGIPTHTSARALLWSVAAGGESTGTQSRWLKTARGRVD